MNRDIRGPSAFRRWAGGHAYIGCVDGVAAAGLRDGSEFQALKDRAAIWEGD
jgi:hypothetical protein